jgi:hypothetical protein
LKNGYRISEQLKKFIGVTVSGQGSVLIPGHLSMLVMSQAQLENKVEDYLHNSQAVEDYWQRPIGAEQLQAEMDRMAQHTKQPEVLRELFQALGNDPFLIAECLARPVLSERLITSFYAYDKRLLASPRADAQRL